MLACFVQKLRQGYIYSVNFTAILNLTQSFFSMGLGGTILKFFQKSLVNAKQGQAMQTFYIGCTFDMLLVITLCTPVLLDLGDTV